MSEAAPDEVRVIGRYALHSKIAAGGMATVHLGRLNGPVGFGRTVAIKRLHKTLARDPEFVAMFLDEARLAARIQHPNVVSIIDVVALDGELFLVLEYILGESLARLLKLMSQGGQPIEPGIVATIMLGILEGLHAAHEARSERGTPLGIVHRDISPQNVLVGADGVARVLDFGIAKAADRIHVTQHDDVLKGKMPYMAPEQVGDGRVDRRTDIWAATVLLWETLTRRRLFTEQAPGALLLSIVNDPVKAPSLVAPCTRIFDGIVARGLAKNPNDRFATARDMAIAIEAVATPASARVVGAWVAATAGDTLRERALLVEEMESNVGAGKEMNPSLTVRGRLAALGMEDLLGDSGSSLPPLGSSMSATGDPRGRAAASGPVNSTTTRVEGSSARSDEAPRSAEALTTEVMVAPGAAPSQPHASAPPPPPVSSPSWGAPPAVAAPPAAPPSFFPPPPAEAQSNTLRIVFFALAIVTLTAALIVLSLPSPAAPTAAPATPATVPPTPPSAVPAEVTSPDPSATVAGSAEPPSTGAPPASRSAVPVPRHHPTTPPRPACNPPYTIGPAPDFIRRPKPECFPR